jgi:hypothetical protein
MPRLTKKDRNTAAIACDKLAMILFKKADLRRSKSTEISNHLVADFLEEEAKDYQNTAKVLRGNNGF